VTCRFQEIVGENGAQERIVLGVVIILLQIFVFCSPVIPNVYAHAGTILRRLSHYLGCGASCRSRKNTNRGQKYATFNASERDQDSLSATTIQGLHFSAELPLDRFVASPGGNITIASVHYKAPDGSVCQGYRRKSSVVGSKLEAQPVDSEALDALKTARPTVAC
jgi:hypothetical protein